MIEQNQFPFQIQSQQKSAGVSTVIAILITAFIVMLLVDIIKNFKGEIKTTEHDRLNP